jgi:hypothetical protein
MKTPTEQLVLLALESSKTLLTESEFQEVFDFNDHREWGIAAETLCDILIENESAISQAQYDAISAAFDAMELSDSPRLSELKKNIQK